MVIEGQYEYETEEVKHIGTPLANMAREACERLYHIDGYRLVVFDACDDYALVRHPDGTYGEPWTRYCPGWVEFVRIENGRLNYVRSTVWRDLYDGFLTRPLAVELSREIQSIYATLSHSDFVAWCDENDGQPLSIRDTTIGRLVAGGGFETMMFDAVRDRRVVGVSPNLVARSRKDESAEHQRRMESVKDELHLTLMSWREEIKSCKTDGELSETLLRFSQLKKLE